MMSFDLSMLGPHGSDQKLAPFNASKFITIEFLGGRLSNCSSLAYLDGGYVYYGSRDGDSYLLKIEDKKTLSKEQPYFSVVRTYQNIGMIYDLQMKHSDAIASKGQQNELIVASGKGSNASISVLKKGVSINELSKIRDLPPLDESCGLSTIKDTLFLKFVGLPQIVPLRCVQQVAETGEKQLTLEEAEACEALVLSSPDEKILLLSENNGLIVLVTSLSLRLI